MAECREKNSKTPGQDQTGVKSSRLEYYKEQPKTEGDRRKHHQNASKQPVCLSKHRSDPELRATPLYNSTRDEKKGKKRNNWARRLTPKQRWLQCTGKQPDRVSFPTSCDLLPPSCPCFTHLTPRHPLITKLIPKQKRVFHVVILGNFLQTSL